MPAMSSPVARAATLLISILAAFFVGALVGSSTFWLQPMAHVLLTPTILVSASLALVAFCGVCVTMIVAGRGRS